MSPTISAENVLIVTQEAHAKGEAYHALLPYQSLFEPVGRNTAPAIALAAAYLTANGADPVMVVLPADHIIKDEVLFRTHLDSAIRAAESGKLVTFGIQPTRPDTGFGYIKVQNSPSSVPHFTSQGFLHPLGGKGGLGEIYQVKFYLTINYGIINSQFNKNFILNQTYNTPWNNKTSSAKRLLP